MNPAASRNQTLSYLDVISLLLKGSIKGLVNPGEGNGKTTWGIPQPLGSIREMTDSAGAVRARYAYDPYGRQTKVSGDLEADFGFTGFYRHRASGLYLTKYRAYDAELGRWISRDPIAERGGLNLYGYVQNNPINRIDPLGLWSPEAHDKLIYYAYWDRLTDGDIFTVHKSSRDFDKATQSAGEAYKHSMARKGQTPADAARQRDQFIAETVAKAKEAWSKCDKDKALRLLGEAAHPLMDSSSPHHVDEQGNPRVWRGLIDAWGHSPPEFIGSETAKDLTREIIHNQQRQLNGLFDQVFGAGTKLK